MISYDDFAKLDIRMGTILHAEHVEGSEKLLLLSVDLAKEQPRQIIAGIAKAYPKTEELIGKQIPILANLEPKDLMGHTSYGMLLAADNNGQPMLLHPTHTIPPGSKVK